MQDPPSWTTTWRLGYRSGRGLRRRCRRESVAAHDLRHPRPVRRTPWRGIEDLCRLAKELRADRGRRDEAEGSSVLAAVVVEPMDGAARNAQCLPDADLDRLSVDGPGQHPLDAIDRLVVVVVAVSGRRQPLPARYHDFECGEAAGGLVRRQKESYGEWPEPDRLVGRIHP